jgi:hypothetical protein
VRMRSNRPTVSRWTRQIGMDRARLLILQDTICIVAEAGTYEGLDDDQRRILFEASYNAVVIKTREDPLFRDTLLGDPDGAIQVFFGVPVAAEPKG